MVLANRVRLKFTTLDGGYIRFEYHLRAGGTHHLQHTGIGSKTKGVELLVGRAIAEIDAQDICLLVVGYHAGALGRGCRIVELQQFNLDADEERLGSGYLVATLIGDGGYLPIAIDLAIVGIAAAPE